jgi:hypothetical protein
VAYICDAAGGAGGGTASLEGPPAPTEVSNSKILIIWLIIVLLLVRVAGQGASLLEVLVGQRLVWKDLQHPLRCATANLKHVLAYCFAAVVGGGRVLHCWR